MYQNAMGGARIFVAVCTLFLSQDLIIQNTPKLLTHTLVLTLRGAHVQLNLKLRQKNWVSRPEVHLYALAMPTKCPVLYLYSVVWLAFSYSCQLLHGPAFWSTL